LSLNIQKPETMLDFTKPQIACMPIEFIGLYKKGDLFAWLQKALYCSNSLAVISFSLMHYHLLSID